mgnify:CR=1 FL=1
MNSMAVPSRFILHQKAALTGIGRLALASAAAPIRRRLADESALKASRRFQKTIDPPSPDLVRRYLEHVGGNPGRYVRKLPPHMFPQWTFDLVGRSLQHLPLPLHQAVNGGCRLVQRAPLPTTGPLEVSGQLTDIETTDRKITLTVELTTGTPGRPDAVVAQMYNVLVGRRSAGGSSDESTATDEQEESQKKGGARVPEGASEVTRWSIPADAGLDFAKLTGDFNPIHWLAPAAKAAGFDHTILHGFSTMARGWEGLVDRAGRAGAIREMDVRFTRPLVLPADVGLFVDDGTVAVGDQPGGAAYMIGAYETEE